MTVIVSIGFSFSLQACFAVAEHVTRYAITIEPDVVSFQREFQGIPVGSKKIYARVLITDLGIRPIENRSGPSPEVGNLCMWLDGKSIQIEPYFPIVEGVSLANELRKLGIVFRQTYPVYDPENLPWLKQIDYLSF